MKSRTSFLRAPKPNGDYWKNFSLGRAYFVVSAMVLARDEWIGVQLVLSGDRGKIRFKELEPRKSEIEEKLGVQLEWRELPSHKESQIRHSRLGIDVKSIGKWPEICDWLIEWTEKFVSLFRPIAKDLDADSDAALAE
ncbi:MAG: DUF4268 domain-containing protein [Gemmataceae bacterium]